MTNPTGNFQNAIGNTENETNSQENGQKSRDSDSKEEEAEPSPSGCLNLVGLNDDCDEFFDVPETTDHELMENECHDDPTVDNTMVITSYWYSSRGK